MLFLKVAYVWVVCTNRWVFISFKLCDHCGHYVSPSHSLSSLIIGWVPLDRQCYQVPLFYRFHLDPPRREHWSEEIDYGEKYETSLMILALFRCSGVFALFYVVLPMKMLATILSFATFKPVDNNLITVSSSGLICHFSSLSQILNRFFIY